MAIQLPGKFDILSIQLYAGIEDQIEHLNNYKTHMDLQGMPQELACKTFPLTLSGSDQEWFRKLPSNSINSFEDLKWKFLTQFLVGCKRKKPSSQLMAIHQKKGKSLKDYVVWFNQARLIVDNPTEKMVYAALYQGNPNGRDYFQPA
jgi:hypothetical protein